MTTTWSCARCTKLRQHCFAPRSKQTRCLCTDCVAELVLDGMRWCNRCNDAYALAAMAQYCCKACERVRNTKYAAKKSEHQRQQYARDPEPTRAKNRAWYATHREHRRAYRATRRDHVCAYRRAWYAAHREHCAQQQRAWRAAHPDRAEATRKRAYLHLKLRVLRGEYRSK